MARRPGSQRGRGGGEKETQCPALSTGGALESSQGKLRPCAATPRLACTHGHAHAHTPLHSHTHTPSF